MFEGGTRVILLASTCRRSTGPKRGSVGFISGSMDSFERATCGKENVLVNGFWINFTRYGFEQTVRHELKYVIATIPHMVNIITDGAGNALRGVSALLSARNSTKFNPIKAKFDINSKEDVAVCVVAPLITNDFNLISCSGFEFNAWLHSILSDPQFRRVLNVMQMGNQFKLFKDAIVNSPFWWKTLSMATISPKLRSDLFVMTKEQETRKELICFIRHVYAMMSQVKGEELLCVQGLCSRALIRGGASKQCFGILMKFLFRRPYKNVIVDFLNIKNNTAVSHAVSSAEKLAAELVLSACAVEAFK